MLRMKSTMAALMLGVTVVGTTVAPVFAGEVTGNSDPANPTTTGARTNANSICAYSGQNDFPDGSASGPPGRVQSFGQDIKLGTADPQAFNPGDACGPGTNPHRVK